MKNGVFGEYFARFEGIWQANCLKDEEVDRLSMGEKAKVGEEKPMRVIMMMKRNTNDDEEVYQWWKEQVKREEGDDEEEEEVKFFFRWLRCFYTVSALI